MTFHEWSNIHLKFVSDHWHVITGVALALWWGLVRIKRAIFRSYVTSEQMVHCKNEIIDRLEAADKRNSDQHDKILDLIVRHIEKSK